MTGRVEAIERIVDPTREEFERDLVQRDKPAILVGAVRSWAALEIWSPAYLTKRVGTCRVAFKRSFSHVHPGFTEQQRRQDGALGVADLARLLRGSFERRSGRVEDTLAAYLGLISASPDANQYYLSGDEVKLSDRGARNPALEVLWNDIGIPDLFDVSRTSVVGLWLSAKGVRSHLHYDSSGHHNLNAQVTGAKAVTVFPPSEASKMYLFHASRFESSNFSRVDVEKPDAELFPRFASARRYEGELRAGDLLFIPSCWFHTFEHLGDFNSNVNFWWKPEHLRASPLLTRTMVVHALRRAMREKNVRPYQLGRLFYELEEALLADDSDPGKARPPGA